MDLYREWAATYPAHAHNRLMEVEQATVLSLLPPVAGRRVLDAGCGTGRYIELLTYLGARVVGDRRAFTGCGDAPARLLPVLDREALHDPARVVRQAREQCESTRHLAKVHERDRMDRA